MQICLLDIPEQITNSDAYLRTWSAPSICKLFFIFWLFNSLGTVQLFPLIILTIRERSRAVVLRVIPWFYRKFVISDIVLAGIILTISIFSICFVCRCCLHLICAEILFVVVCKGVIVVICRTLSWNFIMLSGILFDLFCS